MNDGYIAGLLLLILFILLLTGWRSLLIQEISIRVAVGVIIGSLFFFLLYMAFDIGNHHTGEHSLARLVWCSGRCGFSIALRVRLSGIRGCTYYGRLVLERQIILD